MNRYAPTAAPTPKSSSISTTSRCTPDGVYFGDKKPNDACEYTDGTVKGNWATEWQDSHTKGVDWYECESAHSQPLNANRKAYAAGGSGPGLRDGSEEEMLV